MLLPDVGGVGQRRLLDGAVVVETLDGPTEAAVVYLAAAGVGTIVVRDERPVMAPGFLFENEDVGRPRREAARARIARLNPDVRVSDAGPGVPLPTCPGLADAARAPLEILWSLACA